MEVIVSNGGPSMQKLFILCLVLFSHMSGALTPPQVTEDATVPSVETLYHDVLKNPTQTTKQRVEYFSRMFLGKPYILYPLGEGANGDACGTSQFGHFFKEDNRSPCFAG